MVYGRDILAFIEEDTIPVMLNIYDTRSKSLFNIFAGFPALQSSLCKDGVKAAPVGCGLHALKCLHHTVNRYITYYTFLQGHKPP